MNKVDEVIVDRHPLLAKWALGDRSQNPPQRSLVPPWCLLMVLVALTEKPLQPLHRVTPKDLSLKVLFLLAVPLLIRFLRSMHFALIYPFCVRTHGLALNPATQDVHGGGPFLGPTAHCFVSRDYWSSGAGSPLDVFGPHSAYFSPMHGTHQWSKQVSVYSIEMKEEGPTTLYQSSG